MLRLLDPRCKVVQFRSALSDGDSRDLTLLPAIGQLEYVELWVIRASPISHLLWTTLSPCHSSKTRDGGTRPCSHLSMSGQLG
jgi:hypothetical protein